ncbi:hypothetical protein AB0F17_32915 [Nonomuraea sp. NPDC026600]|uniref:hypothetical protein n=1 Tax=Nonomuraea sp. NPDC026600 TaxID=3155363 RepID=UPI0033E4FCD0
MIDNIDQVLASRDSVRGVTDHRGQSLPAWRALHPYTAGIATLKSADGQPVLEVRSALSYADLTAVTVRAGSVSYRFTLEVLNSRTGATATFADLSMDPASTNFVEKRVLAAYPTPPLVTAKALGRALPALGVTQCVSPPVIFTVHTGMITYPIATFVRLVKTRPELASNSRYQAKAQEYLEAVQAAVAVHDAEWRETADRGGYFVWNKGTPLAYDGTAQPNNQTLALGKTYAELAMATGDPIYSDRVQRLANTFSRELKLDTADNAYTWSYWPTYGRTYQGYTASQNISVYTPSGTGAKQIEDLSHGAIDVEFVAAALRSRLAFLSPTWGARFARTYSRNLATADPSGVPTTFMRVDGTGGLAPEGQYTQAPRWMPFAFQDSKIFTHSGSIFAAREIGPQFGSSLLGVAYLNWYARTGGTQDW